MQTYFVQPGRGRCISTAFADNLIRCFLAGPYGPDHSIRVGRIKYLPLLTGGKDAVDESQIPALPQVVWIGQIHYVVADVN